jgi:hypothetical protein
MNAQMAPSGVLTRSLAEQATLAAALPGIHLNVHSVGLMEK